MKNNQGFTLMELLAVVVIIAVIAAIAIPQYSRSVKVTKIKTKIPLIKSVVEAQKRYFLANDEYCHAFGMLDVSIPGEYLSAVEEEAETFRLTPGGSDEFSINNSGLIAFSDNALGIKLQVELPDENWKCISSYLDTEKARRKDEIDHLCIDSGFDAEAGYYSGGGKVGKIYAMNR